jgi:hypothetical protein
MMPIGDNANDRSYFRLMRQWLTQLGRLPSIGLVDDQVRLSVSSFALIGTGIAAVELSRSHNEYEKGINSAYGFLQEIQH